jgi:hypothetical protein
MMRNIAQLVLIVSVLALPRAFAAAPTPAEAATKPVPLKVETFLKECETLRRGAILRLEHELRGLRSSGTSRTNAARIKRLEEELVLLKSNRGPVVPQLRFPPKVGDIGRLPQLNCHVEQIVTDQEMVVRCSFPLVVGYVSNFAAHGQKMSQPLRVVLRGLPTADVREGGEMPSTAVFEVVGKETFQTSDGGSSALLVLKEFDMHSVEAFFPGPK